MADTQEPLWIRDNVWRQGQVLGVEALRVLGLSHSAFPEDTAVVVISHDCDLANENLTAEPYIEVVIGRRVPSMKGDFSWAKSPRTLHLEYSLCGSPTFIELVAADKVSIDKNVLAPFLPDLAYQLCPKSLSGLRHWLAVRYNRAAYPDQFVDRMKDTKLDEKLAKRIRKYPAISTIFFDVDRGMVLDHTDGSAYELSIVLSYIPGEDPNATYDLVFPAEEEIEKLVVDRTFDAKTETWKGIRLRKCTLISEDELTVSQARLLSQWHLEYMSLRAEDDQPAPYGVRT